MKDIKTIINAVIRLITSHPIVTSIVTAIAYGFITLRLWASTNPILVWETINEYGWDGIRPLSAVFFYALVVITIALFAFILEHVVCYRRATAITITLASYVVAMASAIIFPAYTGPDGLDYVGQAIAVTAIHWYGAVPLALVIQIIALIVGNVHKAHSTDRSQPDKES